MTKKHLLISGHGYSDPGAVLLVMEKTNVTSSEKKSHQELQSISMQQKDIQRKCIIPIGTCTQIALQVREKTSHMECTSIMLIHSTV